MHLSSTKNNGIEGRDCLVAHGIEGRDCLVDIWKAVTAWSNKRFRRRLPSSFFTHLCVCYAVLHPGGSDCLVASKCTKTPAGRTVGGRCCCAFSLSHVGHDPGCACTKWRLGQPGSTRWAWKAIFCCEACAFVHTCCHKYGCLYSFWPDCCTCIIFQRKKNLHSWKEHAVRQRATTRQTPVCIVSLPRLPTHVSRFYALESRSNGCAFKHLLVETMLLMFISFLRRHRRSHPGCAMLLLLNSYACTYMLLNLYNNIHLMLMVCLLKYPADSFSN